MKSTSKEIIGNHDFQNIYEQTSTIVEQARSTAYRQINETLVRRNWLIGKLISEEELKGENRARYGLELIKWLSKRLTAKYGKGFTKTNLYSFTQFYKLFPKIFHSLSGKSPQLLSWTHYRTLLQELNPDARQWYEQEAAEQNWSVRTLQRNICLPPNIWPICQPPNNSGQKLSDRKQSFIFNKRLMMTNKATYPSKNMD